MCRYIVCYVVVISHSIQSHLNFHPLAIRRREVSKFAAASLFDLEREMPCLANGSQDIHICISMHIELHITMSGQTHIYIYTYTYIYIYIYVVHVHVRVLLATSGRRGRHTAYEPQQPAHLGVFCSC